MTLTQAQADALKRQADAQRAAAAQAIDAANKAGIKGAAKLELIAKAIERAAKGQVK